MLRRAGWTVGVEGRWKDRCCEGLVWTVGVEGGWKDRAAKDWLDS